MTSNDRSLERAILLQDVAVVLVALWLANVLRQPLERAFPLLKPAVPTETYLYLLLVFLPTWAWCAERLSLHRVRTVTGPLVELVRALLLTQAWGALGIALILTATQTLLNRSLIALFLAVSTALLLAAKLAQRSWVRKQRGQELALVIGADADAAGTELRRFRGRRLEALADVDPETLRRRIREGGVDEVVLAGEIASDRLWPLLEACDEAGLAALVRLPTRDVGLVAPQAELIGTSIYLSYQRHEPDRPSLLAKAVLDRALAALALVATLPLMALVALAVKLTSRGPVLFVQQRGGVHGRPFPMLKFRTMRVGAELERERLLARNEMDGPVFKISDDPRVTPLGRILRRTSLDELPQLYNVLAGHMSLVGPRPLPVVETRELTGMHRRRLSMKPGLTCLWQVSGRSELTFKEWMALDLLYVDNWSLGLDLALLLRTVPALLYARGAR